MAMELINSCAVCVCVCVCFYDPRPCRMPIAAAECVVYPSPRR